MKIGPKTIQSVQDAVRIEEVVADFIPLKQKGTNHWACCPFHQEKTASFSVSSEKGFYKCFGCGATGDAISFVQQMEESSFPEAIAYLAHKYGIPIESATEPEGYSDERAQKAKESQYILLNMAKDYYANLLWTHPEAAQQALPYLRQRNIPDALVRKFELGYSLNGWNGFGDFAQKQGISSELLLATGLVVAKEGGHYDRFRGRLMFPIRNALGQVVAFGARRLEDSQLGPKYINSPETATYHKGSVLYGLSLAKKAIKQQKRCYLVEGYTDVLALHQAGVEHAVAASGTSLTEEQMQLLRRFTTAVSLVFDGDPAGVQAALKGSDKLLASGFQVHIVPLPPTEDPDSYFRKVGQEAFVDYLQRSSEDFISFKARCLLDPSRAHDPTEQAKAIRSIVESIAAIPDELEQRLFLKRCSALFALEEGLLETTYQTLRRQRQREHGSNRGRDLALPEGHARRSNHLAFKDKLTASIESCEREIMRILLLYGNEQLADGEKLYAYLLRELGDASFRSSDCKPLLAYCVEMAQTGTTPTVAHCLKQGDPSIQKWAIDLTASPHEISAAWRKKYGICVGTESQNLHQMSLEAILRFKIRLVQELIEQNRAALQQTTSETEEAELLQVHQWLKQTEATMAKRLGMVVVR